MSKKFVIGDRLKDESGSRCSTQRPRSSSLPTTWPAPRGIWPRRRPGQPEPLQQTGYFSDLPVYMTEDNKAYKPGEYDSFQS